MSFLEGLNDEQATAVLSRENLVCSAGAGAGKTRVITHRYLHLLENGVGPGAEALLPANILTLTFTRAAAREMKSRIYAAVENNRQSSPAIENAYQNFDGAVITTIDAFCNQIAAAGGGRYGIASSLSVDEQGIADLAHSEIRGFLEGLDERGSALFATAVETFGLEALISKLLLPIAGRAAGFTEQTASIVQSLQEDRDWALQLASERVLQAIESLCRLADILNDLDEERARDKKKKPSVLLDGAIMYCEALLKSCGLKHGADSVQQLAAAKHFLAELEGGREIFLDPNKERIIAAKKPTSAIPMDDRELVSGYWDELVESIPQFRQVAQFFEAFGDCSELAQLLEAFRQRVIRAKRSSGLIEYQDLIELAIRVLQDDKLLADHYRRKFRAIMIDEFQDNNQIQKTLLYLLSVPPGYGKPQAGAGLPPTGAGLPLTGADSRPLTHPRRLPSAEDLEPGKLFFVGDQKQSIYLFRGADVSVFRGLASELASAGGTGHLPLSTNYRSHPRLIESWNELFERIFSPDASMNQAIPEAFQARFEPISPRPSVDPAEPDPKLELWLQPKPEKGENAQNSVASSLLEFRAMAKRIRELLDAGQPVWDRDEARPRALRPSDIGILLRTGSKQKDLEQLLLSYGIPFVVEIGRSLFLDALASDFTHVFLLLLHPDSQNAWAAVARSPFLNLSSDGILELLDYLRTQGPWPSVAALLEKAQTSSQSKPPFSTAEDAEKFGLFLGVIARLSSLVKHMPHDLLCAELWTRYGYRDFVLDRPNAAPFIEQYRQFESFAATNRALSFRAYVAELEKRLGNFEKVDDLADIPAQSDSVRIMTIHSSKGLEFPYVFLGGICSGTRRDSDASEPAVLKPDQAGYISVTLNHNLVRGESGHGLRPAFEMDNRKAAASAELQRLFYVACTRAESGLFLFASPGRTNSDSFEPILAAGLGCDKLEDLVGQPSVHPGFTILPIERLSPAQYEAERAQRTTKLRKGSVKRRASHEYLPLSWPEESRLRNPSRHIHEAASVPAGASVPEPAAAGSSTSGDPSARQARALLLGTLSHEAIDLGLRVGWPEHRLVAGRAEPIDWAGIRALLAKAHERELDELIHLQDPEDKADGDELLDKAVAMARGFVTSKWFAENVLPKQPTFRAEYAYVEWEGQGWIRGTVDLLLFFESGERWVVDFKTDKNLDAQGYAPQLADYARAAQNLHLAGTPDATRLARGFIFSLRSFEAIELQLSEGEPS